MPARLAVPMVRSDLLDLVKPFSTSKTSQAQASGLLRRVDSKFVVPVDDLELIFDGLESSYGTLLAGGRSWATYETLYFDDSEDRCFHDHRRGRLGRTKYRIRHYPERQLSYFEVKYKSNRRVTSKLRRRKEHLDWSLSAEDRALAARAGCVPASQLVPSLWTSFFRLQLIARESRERVTIDVEVTYRHGRDEQTAAFDELARSTVVGRCCATISPEEGLRALAIVEVKQPVFRARTPIMLALRRARARRRSSSKYCTGRMMTSSTLRAHRLLPGLKEIARLQIAPSLS